MLENQGLTTVQTHTAFQSVSSIDGVLALTKIGPMVCGGLNTPLLINGLNSPDTYDDKFSLLSAKPGRTFLFHSMQ